MKNHQEDAIPIYSFETRNEKDEISFVGWDSRLYLWRLVLSLNRNHQANGDHCLKKTLMEKGKIFQDSVALRKF